MWPTPPAQPISAGEGARANSVCVDVCARSVQLRVRRRAHGAQHNWCLPGRAHCVGAVIARRLPPSRLHSAPRPHYASMCACQIIVTPAHASPRPPRRRRSSFDAASLMGSHLSLQSTLPTDGATSPITRRRSKVSWGRIGASLSLRCPLSLLSFVLGRRSLSFCALRCFLCARLRAYPLSLAHRLAGRPRAFKCRSTDRVRLLLWRPRTGRIRWAHEEAAPLAPETKSFGGRTV